MVIHLSDLRCDECGSKDIVAIAPGTDEVRELFLLQREVPVRCRCMQCFQIHMTDWHSVSLCLKGLAPIGAAVMRKEIRK